MRQDPGHIGRNWKRWEIRAAWDLAIGKKDRNDYTVGIVGGMDPEGRVHLLDCVRGRFGSKEIAEAVLDTAQRWRVGMVGLEEGQIKLAVMPYLQDLMASRNFYPAFTEGKSALRPITDKEARARVAQGWLQNGKLVIPHPTHAPWVEVLISELLRFPAGIHDDQVDALAWLMRMFATVRPPQEQKRRRTKSWKDKLKQHIQEGWLKHPMAA